MYEQEQSVIYKLGIQRVYYTTLKMGQKGTLPTRDVIGLDCRVDSGYFRKTNPQPEPKRYRVPVGIGSRYFRLVNSGYQVIYENDKLKERLHYL